MPTWRDSTGSEWRISMSHRRLRFKYPAHAAVRAYVFQRDGFRCKCCGAATNDDTSNYRGRHAVWVRSPLVGWLILELAEKNPRLAPPALHHPDNKFARCEHCRQLGRTYGR